MFAAMVGTAVSHGSEWAKARVLVDSGSEHPPLISQNMADKLGLAGPISGEATQADGAFLPLWDVDMDRNLCQDSCFLQWVIKIVKSKILHCKKAWSNNDMSLLQYVKETIN